MHDTRQEDITRRFAVMMPEADAKLVERCAAAAIAICDNHTFWRSKVNARPFGIIRSSQFEL